VIIFEGWPRYQGRKIVANVDRIVRNKVRTGDLSQERQNFRVESDPRSPTDRNSYAEAGSVCIALVYQFDHVMSLDAFCSSTEYKRWRMASIAYDVDLILPQPRIWRMGFAGTTGRIVPSELGVCNDVALTYRGA